MPVSSNIAPQQQQQNGKNSFHTSASNFIDGLFFLRVFVLIRMVRRIDYIGDLQLFLGKPETARAASEMLAKAWKIEKVQKLEAGQRPSLLATLYRCFGVRYGVLALWKMAWAFFVWFCAYYLVERLLLWADSHHNGALAPQSVRRGIGYATAIFVCCVCSSISYHSLSSQCTRIGIQCRAALVTLIYRKALRLSYVGGIGDVINLISNDCNRVAEACVNWHFLWSAGVESLIIVVLALIQAKGSALVSVLLIVCVFLPIQYILAKRASAISYLATASITKRVALMSEILTTIRLVKFYALESYFQEKIGRARSAEMRRMQKALRLKILNFALIFVAPVLTTLATYVSFYVLSGNLMSPVQLFTIVSLFNTLRYPLLMLPNAVRTIAGAQISLQRLEDYFIQHDVDALPPPLLNEPDSEYVVDIENGSFTMEGPVNVVLEDVSLKLKRGHLAALVGDLDSCKALLFAIMGEVRRHSGTIVTRGIMSYVPQEPWLIQATFRDNILFGSPYDEARYQEVLEQCGLLKEVAALSDGDQTYINDLTLSENQRCRIVLARALYWNPEILIFEDPFSEFSSHVSREILNTCILPFVRQKKKTVLLHTQHRRFLSECDTVIYLKGDKIVCQGSYELFKKQADPSLCNSDDGSGEESESESSFGSRRNSSSESSISESSARGRDQMVHSDQLNRRATSASPELVHETEDRDASTSLSISAEEKVRPNRRHSEQLLRDKQQRTALQFSFEPPAPPLALPTVTVGCPKSSSASLSPQLQNSLMSDENFFPVSIVSSSPPFASGGKRSKKHLTSSNDIGSAATSATARHFRDFSTQSSPSHLQKLANNVQAADLKSDSHGVRPQYPHSNTSLDVATTGMKIHSAEDVRTARPLKAKSLASRFPSDQSANRNSISQKSRSTSLANSSGVLSSTPVAKSLPAIDKATSPMSTSTKNGSPVALRDSSSSVNRIKSENPPNQTLQLVTIETIKEGVVFSDSNDESKLGKGASGFLTEMASARPPNSAAPFFSNHQKTITSLYDSPGQYLASIGGAGAGGLTVRSNGQTAMDNFGDYAGGNWNENNSRQRAPISLRQAYTRYIREGSGLYWALMIIVSYVVVHTGRFISDVWLSWSTLVPAPKFAISNAAYVGIYGGLCGFVIIGVFARGVIFSATVLSRSKGLHNRALKTILRAPLGYFDVTPLGQILSTFAKHLYLIDDFLPEALLQVFSFGPIIFGTLIFSAVYLPYYWATLPAYVILVWLIISFATSAEARLKLLEASNKAPLFSHFSTTLEGVHYIRLCKAQDRFESFFRATVDADHKSLCALMLVRNFHGLYLDLVCALAIYMACIFVVVFKVQPSIAGLAITNTMQLLLFLQWFVRMAQDTHASLDGLRQLMMFTKSIPSESPDIVKEHRVPPDWPQTGAVKIKDLTLRYHRYGAAALKKITAVINPGEKIGIVGTNGAGKTSLIMAFLRAVEYNGSIQIDNQDIKEIGLRDLRRHIAVVPMDPVLLTGTIRSNLDPFHAKPDDEVWKALQSVHLAHKIRESVGKLDAPIVEHGRSFTLAERRLLSIARALLQATKLVIIDEPTSSMDPETDELIQRIIFDKFEGYTVLMMATQLDCVMGCDRLFVLDSGRLVETGTPRELLGDPDSRLLQFAKGFYHSLSATEYAALVQQLADLARKSDSNRAGNDTQRPNRNSVLVPPSLQELFQSSSLESSKTSFKQGRDL